MEVKVVNISGKETGAKVQLPESVFGIEPNDHAIYLDVKQYLANQRQGTHNLNNVTKLQVRPVNYTNKKVLVVLVPEALNLHCSMVVVVFLVHNQETIVLN